MRALLLLLLFCAWHVSAAATQPARLTEGPDSIESHLRIPEGVPPGRYVVQCEAWLRRSGKVRTFLCYSAEKKHGPLVTAVALAGRQARFVAATRDGKPAEVSMQVMVRIDITTGSSGLEPDIDATATLHFQDGKEQVVRLNRGAAITAGRLDLGFNVSVPIATTFAFYAPLTDGHLSSSIDSIRIDAPNLQGEWPITQVTLEAFEEPALKWVEDLLSVTTTLGRTDADCFLKTGYCGVALGTDLNGLAPTIPGTSISPYDPFLLPGKIVLDYPPELGGTGAIDGRSSTGPTKTWDVMSDGIAHVGLLPDFLVAAAHVKMPDETQPKAARVVSTVFHSAGEFVRMWANIEKAKKP